MIYLLGALGALAFLALLAFAVFFARDTREEQRATRLRLDDLEAQLARHHDEQRRHIDAALAVFFDGRDEQRATRLLTGRPRSIPPVEVRPAPPLRPRSDEMTPISGIPRPRGAA